MHVARPETSRAGEGREGPFVETCGSGVLVVFPARQAERASLLSKETRARQGGINTANIRFKFKRSVECFVDCDSIWAHGGVLSGIHRGRRTGVQNTPQTPRLLARKKIGPCGRILPMTLYEPYRGNLHESVRCQVSQSGVSAAVPLREPTAGNTHVLSSRWTWDMGNPDNTGRGADRWILRASEPTRQNVL